MQLDLSLEPIGLRKILMEEFRRLGELGGNLEEDVLAPGTQQRFPGLRWSISQEDSPQEGSRCRADLPIEMD